MAVIRCPTCGKPNPEFLELCQYCDTPLNAPAEGAPAAAAPPTPRGGPNDDTLIRPPIWDLTDDAPAKTSGTPPPAEDESLDWMERLRRRQEGEAAPPEPDWMWTGAAADASPRTPAPAESATPAAPEILPPAVDDGTPDWLTALARDEAQAPPPASPISASASLVARPALHLATGFPPACRAPARRSLRQPVRGSPS